MEMLAAWYRIWEDATLRGQYPLLVFLFQAVVISLSGVLAPGPVTTATLAAGSRSRHAGAWIAIGHGIVEFPLMGLIMLGAGVVLKMEGFKIGVGLAGGAVLFLLAVMMLLALRRPAQQESGAPKPARPLWTGIVLTGGNPYFLLWWATVGLGLAAQAKELGVLALGLFAIVHWMCDLVWLEVLSFASNKGVGIFGRGSQRVVLVICSGAMAVFGVLFVTDAVRALQAAVR